MLVAICDDDAKICETIKIICEDVLKKKLEFTDVKVLLFSDGKELIEHIDEPDIVILDIEMPKLDGLLVKQKLQSLDKRILIIFVTGHSEMISEAIGINVFGFIDKKVLNTQLPIIFEQAVDMVNKEIMIDGKIKSSKVKYIKSDHIYVILVLENGEEYLVRTSMKTLEHKLLQFGFIRTHKKYIVNMYWIDKIDAKGIHIGDSVISISSGSKKKIKKAYDEYCIQNAKYC